MGDVGNLDGWNVFREQKPGDGLRCRGKMWEVNGSDFATSREGGSTGGGGILDRHAFSWITSPFLPSHLILLLSFRNPSCSFCENRKESHADTVTKELQIDIYWVFESKKG